MVRKCSGIAIGRNDAVAPGAMSALPKSGRSIHQNRGKLGAAFGQKRSFCHTQETRYSDGHLLSIGMDQKLRRVAINLLRFRQDRDPVATVNFSSEQVDLEGA